MSIIQSLRVTHRLWASSPALASRAEASTPPRPWGTAGAGSPGTAASSASSTSAGSGAEDATLGIWEDAARNAEQMDFEETTPREKRDLKD